MRLQLLTFVATLVPYTLAGLEFTSPRAGATVQAGNLDAEWDDDGDSPSIDDLQSYTIQVWVGGNSIDDAIPLGDLASGVAFGSRNSVTGDVPPGSAESVRNGFYLKMIAVGKTGGQYITHSNRFTINGMTGTLADRYTENIPSSSSSVPPDEDSLVDGKAAGAVPAAGEGVYTVPYGLQTGLTKYAPMQKVPATKMSNKQFTPLHPTSAFTIATTWLPKASIVTTMTASQTYSVSSRENPAAPQSHPTDDMAKFLARWKD